MVLAYVTSYLLSQGKQRSTCGKHRELTGPWNRISVHITMYRRLRIGRDRLDQSEGYDTSYVDTTPVVLQSATKYRILG